MNTKQMLYFLTVAEELNFRKAAVRLHMTQPPLSMQIATLEEELGVRLFRRDRRRVELTEAGKILAHDTRKILSDIESAQQRAIDVGNGITGRLRVGFVGPAIDGPLAPDLKKFRTQNPEVVFELTEATTEKQIRMVREQELDMGIVRLLGHDTTALACTLYHAETYVLAVPQDHLLANEKSVPLTQLDNEPLIFFPRHINPTLHDAWITAFAKAQARMRRVQQTVTKHTSVALVAAGHGVALVPESTARTGRAGVRFIPLRGIVPTLEIHLIHDQRRLFPLADSFHHFLLNQPK